MVSSKSSVSVVRVAARLALKLGIALLGYVLVVSLGWFVHLPRPLQFEALCEYAISFSQHSHSPAKELMG